MRHHVDPFLEDMLR